MCGIAGFYDVRNRMQPDDARATIARMCGTLAHRGPDGEGIWFDERSGVALGQRRLAIVDLSEAGRQPMISASGRCAISFNGEIYNAEDLRKELGGSVSRWRGHSDTEVLLEALEIWGVQRALEKTIGMFALAFFDTAERTLTLARDRFGEKPLYWTSRGDRLIFGSELRALRAHPDFSAEINRDALVGFIRRGYFLHPSTVYAGVHQLPPGTMLTVGLSGDIEASSFWSLADVVARARAEPFLGSDEDAVDALEDLLTDAIRRQLVADVPVGAFLSGGYDLSTTVALMQTVSTQPVRTYSIGFEEAGYNEADNARRVAAHLKTNHTELVVTPREAMDVVPHLADIYDEPFADSSQIPTYLVAKLARRSVTVALSGDGGDELFAGYSRYLHGDLLQQQATYVPKGVRQFLSGAALSVPPHYIDAAARVLPAKFRLPALGDKVHKLAEAIVENDHGIYSNLTSQWKRPSEIVPDGHEAVWPNAEAHTAAGQLSTS